MSRRHRDAPGVRRASREFGPKARGYGRRQRPMGQRDGMWRKFGRRASKAGRFGWKHRKRAFGLVAGVAFAYVAIYFAYVGTVSLVQVLVVVGALGVAGLAAHNDNMKLRRSLADQPKPSFSQQKEWARGRGEPHARPEPTPDTIRVRSHRNDGHGVTEHTRRRPGAGTSAPGGPCHCCGATKAPSSVTIEGRRFPACVRCAAESGWGEAS